MAVNSLSLDRLATVTARDERPPLDLARLQRGIAGEKGERGERGTQGESGKPIVLKGWTIDREKFVAVPLMSDGSRGPALELRGLFEQFQHDVG